MRFRKGELKYKLCKTCDKKERHRSKAGLLSVYCLECGQIHANNEYQKRKGEGLIKVKSRKKSEISPEDFLRYSNYVKKTRFKKVYGITLEEYEQLKLNQNNCCAICNKHRNEFKNDLHLDHDHKTGKIRGFLCGRCNPGLGHFDDNIDKLKAAIKYLEFHIEQQNKQMVNEINTSKVAVPLQSLN